MARIFRPPKQPGPAMNKKLSPGIEKKTAPRSPKSPNLSRKGDSHG